MNIGNIPPSILESIHAQPLKWHIVIGELCDNSFDAGASRIDICFEKEKTLVVKDDGCGCDDIEQMLTLGKHYRHSTTALGRFGVGLKEAACWLWGDLRIKTCHKHTMRKAQVNWPRLSKGSSWIVPDPSVTQESVLPSGTELTFRNFKRHVPDYSLLVDELSYIFSPALRSGRQIVLKFPRKKPVVCAAWSPPSMEKVLEDEFKVDGKGVKFRVGAVPEGTENERPGFSFSHKHRIVLQSSALGSNGHSVSRICGLVELDGRWTLSKNKTDIVDEQQPLADAIWERCEDLIKESAKQAKIMSNRELETKVSAALQLLMTSPKKARRGGDNRVNGTQVPTNKGVKHRRAKKVQPGESFIEKCKAGAFRMERESRENGPVGRVDLPGNVIYLNESHNRIKHHIDSDNSEALVDVCITLLSHVAIETGQRDRFPAMRNNEGFIEILSTILAAQEPGA